MVRLSFIVPCYNVERFISKCLGSIFSCDIPEDEFEVICIDDSSSDTTVLQLKRWLATHRNIRVITNPVNKGIGATRNIGIRESHGKYLWFVDSDDFICGRGIDAIVKDAEARDVDVLCFNYRKTDYEGNELSAYYVFSSMSSIDGYSFVNKVFGNSIVYHIGYVCRFLYRSSFIQSNQLFFPEGVIWEDTVYMPKAMLKAKSIASVPNVLYSYRTNPTSISNVFLKSYPAKQIFDWSFRTGKELLDFSSEVKDFALKEAFKSVAIRKYINGFSLLLFRTSVRERKCFYRQVRESRKDVNNVKKELNLLNRILLSPVGPAVASIGAAVYKLTHNRRHV